MNAIVTINVGDMVRSHDFEERERPGRGPCYVEGKVLEIGKVIEGCPRYTIRVTREVWNGKEVPATAAFSKRGILVHPPVNGTPTSMGGVTNMVEKL